MFRLQLGKWIARCSMIIIVLINIPLMFFIERMLLLAGTVTTQQYSATWEMERVETTF